jgi:hypothetical protein
MYVTKVAYKITFNKEIIPFHVGVFVTTSDEWFQVLQLLEI